MADVRIIIVLFAVSLQGAFSTSRVHFTAFTNRHYSNFALRLESVVKFQDVEVNVGNAYIPLTGLFRAPFDGSYRFDWSYLITQNGLLWLCLEINGACVVKSVGDSGSGLYQEVSRSAIFRLSRGDSVRIAFHHGDGSVYGSEGRYTSFSGQFLDY